MFEGGGGSVGGVGQGQLPEEFRAFGVLGGYAGSGVGVSPAVGIGTQTLPQGFVTGPDGAMGGSATTTTGLSGSLGMGASNKVGSYGINVVDEETPPVGGLWATTVKLRALKEEMEKVCFEIECVDLLVRRMRGVERRDGVAGVGGDGGETSPNGDRGAGGTGGGNSGSVGANPSTTPPPPTTATAMSLQILSGIKSLLRDEVRELGRLRAKHVSLYLKYAIVPGQCTVSISLPSPDESVLIIQIDKDNYSHHNHINGASGGGRSGGGRGTGGSGSGSASTSTSSAVGEIEKKGKIVWTVARTVGDFIGLHRKLLKKVGIVSEFDFPGWGERERSRDGGIMRVERVEGLERYLQRLVDNPEICQTDELRRFLSTSSFAVTSHYTASPTKSAGFATPNTSTISAGSVFEGTGGLLGTSSLDRPAGTGFPSTDQQTQPSPSTTSTIPTRSNIVQRTSQRLGGLAKFVASGTTHHIRSKSSVPHFKTPSPSTSIGLDHGGIGGSGVGGGGYRRTAPSSLLRTARHQAHKRNASDVLFALSSASSAGGHGQAGHGLHGTRSGLSTSRSMRELSSVASSRGGGAGSVGLGGERGPGGEGEAVVVESLRDRDRMLPVQVETDASASSASDDDFGVGVRDMDGEEGRRGDEWITSGNPKRTDHQHPRRTTNPLHLHLGAPRKISSTFNSGLVESGMMSVRVSAVVEPVAMLLEDVFLVGQMWERDGWLRRQGALMVLRESWGRSGRGRVGIHGLIVDSLSKLLSDDTLIRLLDLFRDHILRKPGSPESLQNLRSLQKEGEGEDETGRVSRGVMRQEAKARLLAVWP
ncbi:hypothetical protein HK102_007649, partial [Quaeritorhiza haematococci]